MATGWQREFAAANKQTAWNEQCLREDIRAKKVTHRSVLELACTYDLSERKVRHVLEQERQAFLASKNKGT